MTGASTSEAELHGGHSPQSRYAPQNRAMLFDSSALVRPAFAPAAPVSAGAPAFCIFAASRGAGPPCAGSCRSADFRSSLIVLARRLWSATRSEERRVGKE